ncbi:protein-domain-containing protein [Radiomyces spectabilis]|uniref:protein-domain-containing protein n=1 Tax=Radiomyces spectabilis TaxID=64574 RepID=UPI00221F8C9A|nr:protein-domain-containing protein [Radiomyces spectabilis]KAI8376412.1 protein-domain-containing protein [Radiomyces spectabilis]
MDPHGNSGLELFDFDVLDQEDELEVELARYYAQFKAAAKDKTDIELHSYLQDKVSQSKRDYNETVSALLYGALTEPPLARKHFQCLSFVNRDNFATIIQKLHILSISLRFSSLKLRTKEQMFWIMNELTSLDVPNIDTLYLCLFRQIKCGDTGQHNILLVEHILKLLDTHRRWLFMLPRVVATAAYTFLRLISDHRGQQWAALQQKEIRFVVGLLREKWMECCAIGRDLVRLLHDVAGIPEITQLWDDILNAPQKMSSHFTGIDMLLKSATPKEFLRSRLTPDMEHKLLFILQNLRINAYQRNLSWFIQRYLSTTESEPFFVDVIRYITAGWYPNNQILQSNIVPRYVIIGSMLRAIKSPVVTANVKTALIYDWLFFTALDNLMFIEPAMLLMERSAERYPHITSSLVEFLKFSMDEYYPPMREYMKRSIACGMRIMLEKGVIRSLTPVYKCPSVNDDTRLIMKELFSDFLEPDQLPIPGTLPRNASTPQSLPASTTVEVAEQPTEQKLSDAEFAESDVIDGSSIPPPSAPGTDTREHLEDEDVDRFLYGDMESSEESAPVASADKGETTVTDMEITPNAASTEIAPLHEASVEDTIVEESEHAEQQEALADKAPEVEEAVMAAEAAMDWDEDLEEHGEEEEEVTPSLQSNQSYWIFGDSLQRFQSACLAVNKGPTSEDDEQYEVQLIIAKRSLKEILAVYLRMAIPAETLAPSLGPHIRNIASRLLLEHSHVNVEKHESVDGIIMDKTKDPFDVIMGTFWEIQENEPVVQKLIRFIGCITHKYSKSRRHLIGMRWWSYIISRLSSESNDMEKQLMDRLSLIARCYQAIVMYGYPENADGKDRNMGDDEFLKQYVAGDLQLLAELNIQAFYKGLSLISQYLPDSITDNAQLTQLTESLNLPPTLVL